MTTDQIITAVGLLIAAWASGFTGGYLMTKYREAINAAG